MSAAGSLVRALTETDSYRYQAIAVTSDTMHPTLKPDDVVIFDAFEDRVTSDGIYLFVNGNIVQPRRVERLIGGDVMIRCDNPLWESERISRTSISSLFVLGRVVGHLRKL